MQAETSPTPVFDALVASAEGGNPFGAHRDMPVPRFTLIMPPSEWPDVEEILGPRPGQRDSLFEPVADPTIQFAAVPVDSALSLIDQGELPIGAPIIQELTP